MAKIASESRSAEVVAMGEQLSATVNFSGALMEMLATVYVYILMSAIREAIQNACDASKRAGLSFSEGVTVLLPTQSNPMITIIDRGSGMTKEFMESPQGYLSFGTSTKNSDNNAAGGLGVGRWAAYGYIRECYITTCHESDMVARTYFQYQGAENTPCVQAATEVPGTQTGTRVFFPVKEHDIDETYRAVAWLKEVMELTMGDSFAVDKPNLLPKVLPEYSTVPLELGEFDPGLAGIVVHPMQGNALKYSRQGLMPGSLVVLTNKEAGVGGLPFHVQSPSDSTSVFASGMVIEIPMSFGIPFMPSREELKYTDDVNHLLRRIDAAALLAVTAKAELLYNSPALSDKGLLSRLLGTATQNWHTFSLHGRANGPIGEALMKVTGYSGWTGLMRISTPSGLFDDDTTVRYASSGEMAMNVVFGQTGALCISDGKGSARLLNFAATSPIVLVANDLPAGGLARFKMWLGSRRATGESYLFISSKGSAVEKAESISAQFGGALPILCTSSFPAAARVVKGKSVTRLSSVTSLTYYCTSADKQVQATLSFSDAPGRAEHKRIWLGKDGAKLSGFTESTGLVSLTSYGSSLQPLLKMMGVDRLYLLSPKQEAELLKLQREVAADGWLSMDEASLAGDVDALAAVAEAKNIAGWQSFEAALQELLDSPLTQQVLAGKVPLDIVSSYQLDNLVKALAKSPRMELVGTAFDKAIAGYLDVLTGTVHVIHPASIPPERRVGYKGLAMVAGCLQETEHDSAERKRLIDTARQVLVAGTRDYAKAWNELSAKFPLVAMVANLSTLSDTVASDFSRSLAALYR